MKLHVIIFNLFFLLGNIYSSPTFVDTNINYIDSVIKNIKHFDEISISPVASDSSIDDTLGHNLEIDSLTVKIKNNLKSLNLTSPINYEYNSYVLESINRYLLKDKNLIPKMLSLSEYYFPIFEQQLDRFHLPLELKYLAIVESSLNPNSVSKSGATGLWQFIYSTGKEYGLNVTSYIDERKDPLKSTIAACEYFTYLFEIFEDWNLVLAAYNGGPGYIKRAMIKHEVDNYWDLRQYLRKETQGYVPTFFAISYLMTYHEEYNISKIDINLNFADKDTISFQRQVPFYLLKDRFCIDEEIIYYLNPSLKKELALTNDPIFLPNDVILDIVRNEKYFYEYLERVNKKEILVNEKRKIYVVVQGDCLSTIARNHNIKVKEIIEWNNLDTDRLSISDELILYIPIKNE